MYSGELEVQAKRKAIAVLQDEINRILNAARELATLPELMIKKRQSRNQKHPDFIQAGFLAIGSFIGGLVGARLSLDIKERYLQILVSVVILIAAAKLFFDSLSDNSMPFGF